MNKELREFIKELRWLSDCCYRNIQPAQSRIYSMIANRLEKIVDNIPSKLPCPKCGSLDIFRRYKNMGEDWSEYGDGKVRESEYTTIDKWCGLAKKDCIIHHCRCCQYEWDTGSL